VFGVGDVACPTLWGEEDARERGRYWICGTVLAEDVAINQEPRGQ
jgi:hypothetical protein